MARRTFDVIDVCETFTHWHAGRSKNEVAGSLGLARNTVRKYVAAAEAAGMVPGGPPVSQERWAELAREWFPELADTRACLFLFLFLKLRAGGARSGMQDAGVLGDRLVQVGGGDGERDVQPFQVVPVRAQPGAGSVA